MWTPPINFVTLHYAYILSFGIWALIILYPYGNLAAVDAYFFGVSASTESGLNTVDVKALKTYQQLFIYFVPILTNLGFINIAVVVVRLYWFRKQIRASAPYLLKQRPRAGRGTDDESTDVEHRGQPSHTAGSTSTTALDPVKGTSIPMERLASGAQTTESTTEPETTPEPQRDEQDEDGDRTTSPARAPAETPSSPHIAFTPDTNEPHPKPKALYIPSPMERERGQPVRERDASDDEDEDLAKATAFDGDPSQQMRWRKARRLSMTNDLSIERVASSMFVIGSTGDRDTKARRSRSSLSQADLPYLSREATVGRNSQFHNLTAQDREELGGIEYRSLKLLLKVVVGYFVGLHLFGAICLIGWIQYANSKYTGYLDHQGQNKIWWAVYSAQTMVDNLGFTLTADSMIHFQDAIFPLLVMSFLAYAGNTCYPCGLRLVLWTMSKLVPARSALEEPLNFLLEHPRRCYTLLFPSRPTWILFGILFALNFIDTLLIVVLDLSNPVFAHLSGGERFVASLFQAASSRHTGTSTFNLADVHPAVQFSLLIMMYISVYPIAISIRASNTDEERALGVYEHDHEVSDATETRSYVSRHLQNQLSFDLWYIFLGIFCICIAEADQIRTDPSFSVFAIFFEVVSAYGNVGLSLGYPTVLTSLCGRFTPFSKVVICAMMIRGRHRGLPVTLDRAVTLPQERFGDTGSSPETELSRSRDLSQTIRDRTMRLKRFRTD